jgi:predicted phosphodiesterase
MFCPQCNSSELRKAGKTVTTNKQRYKCRGCDHITSQPLPGDDVLSADVEEKRVKEVITVEQEHRLKRENANLKNELKRLIDDTDDAKLLVERLTQAKSLTLHPPTWLSPKNSKEHEAVPTLFLSDTHFDEVVNPAEVNFVNAYDRDIANQRLERFFTNGIKLIHRTGAKVPGVVLALGGDIVSGNIHDELAQSNEAGIMSTIEYYTQKIAAGIKLLAKEFGEVYIPCVTGNHGRNTQKPRNKGRAEDNFDWLIYRMLAWHFEKAKNITFNIPLNTDARWQVYGVRYQMTHGDQFRGGSGIGGINVPILRGDARKRNREQATNTPYDILIMGHFHQLKDLGKVIINGSLKGLDEYAMANNFDFEPPQQAFWLTDKKYGKTIFAPIFVEPRKSFASNDSQYVAYA